MSQTERTELEADLAFFESTLGCTAKEWLDLQEPEFFESDEVMAWRAAR